MTEKALVETEDEETVKDEVSEVEVKGYSPLVHVSFRMPTPMFETLEKYCQEHRLKRSEALNEALTILLEKREENVDKRHIEKLIVDSTKKSWGEEIFDIRLAGKLALERNIVGDQNWTDEHLEMVLKEYSEYAEAEELDESDIKTDLKFFASAVKVKPKRVVDLYEELGHGNPEENEDEEW